MIPKINKLHLVSLKMSKLIVLHMLGLKNSKLFRDCLILTEITRFILKQWNSRRNQLKFPLPVLPFVHHDLLFLIVIILEHVVLVHFLARKIPPRHGSSGGCLRADRNVEIRFMKFMNTDISQDIYIVIILPPSWYLNLFRFGSAAACTRDPGGERSCRVLCRRLQTLRLRRLSHYRQLCWPSVGMGACGSPWEFDVPS